MSYTQRENFLKHACRVRFVKSLAQGFLLGTRAGQKLFLHNESLPRVVNILVEFDAGLACGDDSDWPVIWVLGCLRTGTTLAARLCAEPDAVVAECARRLEAWKGGCGRVAERLEQPFRLERPEAGSEIVAPLRRALEQWGLDPDREPGLGLLQRGAQ